MNPALSEARGTVICVHRLGATVRLDDGTLAAVPAGEVAAHQGALTASMRRREPIPLVLEQRGRRKTAFVARDANGAPVSPAPVLLSHDSVFEEQMRLYLKATEEWAPPDRPEPAERHLVRKRRRAAYFEARAKGT